MQPPAAIQPRSNARCCPKTAPDSHASQLLGEDAVLHARNTDRLAMLDALQAEGPQSQSLEALDDFLREYVNQGNVHAPLYAHAQRKPGVHLS
jgi:hypothetical protein